MKTLMLGYRQRYRIITLIADDYTGRERISASPKEQVMKKIMNLSGKRTRIGRSSGECFVYYRTSHQRGKPVW